MDSPSVSIPAAAGGIRLVLPTSNPALNVASGYTLTMVVALETGAGERAPQTYNLTPLPDGSGGYLDTTGNEFPVPGVYSVELHALANNAPPGTKANKSRVRIEATETFD